MASTGDQHEKQHEEMKARVYAIEHSLGIVAQIIHTLHKGDMKLGGAATEELLKLVKTMPGASGTVR